MRKLTARQREIFLLIQKVQQETGMPPTRTEIAAAFNYNSVNAAEEHLRALESKGMIELLPGRARGIRLKQPVGGQVQLPLIGDVTPGTAILSEENVTAHYSVDSGLFENPAHFLLRVHDMSIGDAGILDGDLVAVHRTSRARNRQVVVARLEENILIRRYWQEDRQVWLMKERPDIEPIEIDLHKQALEVEGIVVGVIRDSVV